MAYQLNTVKVASFINEEGGSDIEVPKYVN